MRNILLIFFVVFFSVAKAQRNEILDSQISSLQVVADDNWLSIPIIELGTNQRININFDDLTHHYRRFAYKLEHCEADWSVSSQLFESDFVSGFASGNLIEDIEESVNTTVLYTHYRMSIPNRNCNIKMSGNYRLTIYDDNDEEKPVIVAYFMVVEPIMGVQLSMSSNTDVDINQSHQQIAMQINYGNMRVINYQDQIKTVLLQNGLWSNARINAKPQYVMTNGLRWEHCKNFIFDGGNEFHKFEVLDPTHPTLGVDRIDWDGHDYQVYLFPDVPSFNYVYDFDANGSFYIRNSDNIENDRISDYVLVNFTLHTPQKYDGDIYINAKWTNDQFLPRYKMLYDEQNNIYHTTISLKLGYYSYQYLLIDRNGNIQRVPSEGNFFQTENLYDALIYYREQGGRTDRLVGYGHLETR
ncbi:MAG: DUF5103 domain-containing protein [Prevotella sp.]|nr:DUF5103 domain-containing protein [Prevotella sp.]